jgi:hypothetical protein
LQLNICAHPSSVLIGVHIYESTFNACTGILG